MLDDGNPASDTPRATVHNSMTAKTSSFNIPGFLSVESKGSSKGAPGTIVMAVTKGDGLLNVKRGLFALLLS